MSSSDEMYDRGVWDAEHNDFNSFYYQHYFYYRRGYDDAQRFFRHKKRSIRSLVRSMLINLAIIILVVSGIGFGIQQLSPLPASETGEIAADQNSPTTVLSPLPTKIIATRPPAQLPMPTTQATLRVGITVRVVNVGASPLRARSGPGLDQPVQARFAEETQVTIVEGPIEADGYIWWRIQSGDQDGWSADRSVEGMIWLEP